MLFKEIPRYYWGDLIYTTVQLLIIIPDMMCIKKTGGRASKNSCREGWDYYRNLAGEGFMIVTLHNDVWNDIKIIKEKESTYSREETGVSEAVWLGKSEMQISDVNKILTIDHSLATCIRYIDTHLESVTKGVLVLIRKCVNDKQALTAYEMRGIEVGPNRMWVPYAGPVITPPTEEREEDKKERGEGEEI